MSARALKLCGLVVLAAVTSAHVGSPDVYFEGVAGPYGVRVIVRTPGVVPGLAEITVRVTSGGPVSTVAVVPSFYNIGLKGAPPPDTAQVVTPGLYDARLWLMRGGPYSLYVTVTGPAGQGIAVVPVVAVATSRLGFDRKLAIGLMGAGLFLLVGAVTILRAAAKESTLAAGQAPTRRNARNGWITAGVSGTCMVVLLWYANGWWSFEDANYRRSMYRPWQTAASVSGSHVTFKVTDTVWRFRAPLIPDHGKLMHLFLVRQDDGAFAHLHPAAQDSTSFVATASQLPAGRYRAYGDIVFETGGTRTLVADLDVPTATPTGRPSDPDDAEWTGTTVDDSVVSLGDGLTMTWSHPRNIVPDSDAVLQFTVRDAKGAVATLEPYMGMAAHAVVVRDDGAVFIHLHPMGTISVAAQQAFQLRQPGDTVLGTLGRRITVAQTEHGMPMNASGAFSFPYAFPQPGHYHVWVQVKHGNKVLTGAFATTVGRS